MKIACVGKTASDRLELQKLLNEAFDSSREAIGHLVAIEFTPTTKEELLIGGFRPAETECRKGWSGIILGPEYKTEELFSIATEFRNFEPELPLFCFISTENYSLRILRRLEKLSIEVFRSDDSPARIVHAILRITSTLQKQPSGKLIVFDGAKGGQGCSTLVVGIAHAASVLGKNAVIVDLSKQGSLFHYLQAGKWQSSDYRTLLVDRINATKALSEKLVVEAPNGIKLLLPPAGGAEVRELWIRSPQSFEITLSIIEILKDCFDLVLVDLSHAEGLLPFSLVARADVRAVVASNEPAAIHLLNDKLLELDELPNAARTLVLLNLIVEHSLTKGDVEDYLLAQEAAASIELAVINFDQKGSTWVGTGNSIFTEGSSAIQMNLKALAAALSEGVKVRSPETELESGSKLSFMRKLIGKRKGKRVEQALLNAPIQTDLGDINFILTDELKSSFRSVTNFQQSRPKIQSESLEGYRSPTVSKVRAAGG